MTSPDPLAGRSLRAALSPRSSRLIDRRSLLKTLAVAAGAVGAGELLADCGIPGAKARAGAPVAWNKFWAEQQATKNLNFANWPLYIDSEHGKSQSLEMFTGATGIAVNYQPVIQGDASFYATVEPQLAAREDTGYDIMVMTNGWPFAELINNDFLTALDHSRMPNFFKNASTLSLSPIYDPGNVYSVTWQTGFTGIAYNPEFTKREITSFQDLMDPAFSGRVGMMNDLVELGCAALLATGVIPGESTHADWLKASKWLKKQRPLVSNYYDQSYISHLENGDTWITQAWSGDVFQANLAGYTKLKFVTPVEGQIVWHDNMIIPRQAKNPVSAMEWINYYYQPSIAGIVADWVEYVCPVPAAQDYILNVIGDPTVANSPLVFPSAEVSAVSHGYYVFKDYDDYQLWNTIFGQVVQT